MQRKAIRATVGAADVDIPIHTFLPNQFVYYDGSGTGALTTLVAVQPVGTPVSGNLASWFNAEKIQDSGILASNIVTNPGPATPLSIAVFVDSTGQAIASSGVLATGQALSNISTANGRYVDTFVVGPGISVDQHIAVFSGTNSFQIADGGLLLSNLVTSASTPSANQLATFTGTGKAIQNVTVTVIGGALTNVATINGIDPATWVVGPASSTADAIATYSGTTGKLLLNTAVTISGTTISGATVISGKTISTLVNGSTGSVNGNLPSYSGTTGQIIQDSGIVATNVVTSASTPSANQVATFTGTGKAIQNVTVTISGGAITNVATVNGTNPTTWVIGPATVTSFNVPCFNGTNGRAIIDSGVNIDRVVIGPASTTLNRVPYFSNTVGNVLADSGKLYTDVITGVGGFSTVGDLCSYNDTVARVIKSTGISQSNVVQNVGGTVTADDVVVFNGTDGRAIKDTGIASASLVTSASSPSANQVAAFTGSGKAIQSTTVTISGGVITNVVSLNGIVIGDIMFADSSAPAFEGNDVAVGGVGNVFRPNSVSSGITSSQTVSSSYVEPTGFRIIGPNRTGDFIVTWDFCLSFGDTSGNVGVKVFWSSGTGNAFCTFNVLGTLVFTTSGTASTFTLGATAPATSGCRCVLTVAGASANVNCYMQFQKSSGVSYTIRQGGFVWMKEED